MKFNLILLMGLFVFAACEDDKKEEIDESAPNVTEVLFDGIDVKGDAFEIAQGEKLQITVNAEDQGFIHDIHVTVYQVSSTGEGLDTTPLEFNQTFTIDVFETASHMVLIAAEIPATTDLGVYKIDIELGDKAGNTGMSTTSFTLVAAVAK